MGTTMVSPPVAKAKALACPNCGGAVEIRGFAHTLSVVCPSCLSVLDATTPEFEILQKYHGKLRVQPKIPLGSRGKLDNTLYEIIGFQQRAVVVDGDTFSWDEYLLFNPYKGFRYLSEYLGHWNYIRVLSALPAPAMALGKPAVQFAGRRYLGFDKVMARTSFVLGEFPWRVQVGDAVNVEDFVAPPYMLSSEATSGEVTWSLGEYMAGAKLWEAFRAPGSAPVASGVFANQPSPVQGKAKAAWRTWFWLEMVLLAIAVIFHTFIAQNRVVFDQNFVYSPALKTEASFVTPNFELTGRASNVQIRTETDLSDNWAYFNFALINEESGKVYDFGREVSYYSDGGETEGSRTDAAIIPAVPAGRYYLRVEPEMSPGKNTTLNYRLVVRRDVPNSGFFWLAAVLLLIPPIVVGIRSARFEAARWRESDYAPSSSGGGD